MAAIATGSQLFRRAYQLVMADRRTVPLESVRPGAGTPGLVPREAAPAKEIQPDVVATRLTDTPLPLSSRRADSSLWTAGGRPRAAPEVGGPAAGPLGLVPSAISRGNTVTDPDGDVGGAFWTPTFPGADLVQHAADMLPSIREASGRDAVLTEGPRWEIKVSPGTIRIRTRDYARAERAHERGVHRDIVAADIAATWGGGDLPEAVSTRGTITAWSGRSRLRMIERLAELDYSCLYGRFLRCADCGAEYDEAWRGRCLRCLQVRYVVEDRSNRLPGMLTYTYPGDWLTVAPSAEAVKDHFDAWCRRYEQAWGEPFRGVWKREFQGRGAPHKHIGTTPPMGRVTVKVSARTARALVEDERLVFKLGVVPQGNRVTVDFARWLSISWAEVVDHPDEQQFRNHLLAGTGVDYAQGIKLTDPRRMALYFSKYGQGGTKEYQNQVPAEWVDAVAVCLAEDCGEQYDADLHECPICGEPEASIDYRGSVGRFWGVRGLRPAVAVRQVTPAIGVIAGRLARRWYRSKGHTRVVSRPRVQRPTGEPLIDAQLAAVGVGGRVRYRRSRSRKELFRNGRGFLCVNDGPAFASQLARYLAGASSCSAPPPLAV
jgi:hypothetical protein